MKTHHTRCSKWSLAVIMFLLPASFSWGQEKEKITFTDHAAPIFQKRCAGCHNSDKRSGGLDITNFTNFMEGGGSGSSIEAGDSENSYLFSLITHEDSPEMPPGAKIPDKEIELIQKWIDGGALENKGSKAIIKPKFDLGMSGSPLVRPTEPPLPARMPLEPVIRTPRPAAVPAMATSPWAPLIAIAGQKQILIYNTSTLQLAGVLPNGGGQSNSLRFSRNGSFLMGTGGLEGAVAKVNVWNIRTGELITTVANEIDSILAADISPDHSRVAIGGPQKVVRIYSTADGSLLYEIKKHTDWVTAIEFSPDGKYLATGDRNGGLFTWRVDTGDEHLTLKAHSKMISSVSWRGDGKLLASGSEDASIRLWESEDGKQVKNWSAHGGGVTSIEFTRDGKIASCGRDSLAKLWKQDGGLLKQFAGLTDVAVSVTFCDESARLICGNWAGQVRVWNAGDGKHLGDLEPNPQTLAQRLQESQALASEARSKQQPLAAAFAQVQKSLADQQALLKVANETQTKLESQLQQLQAKIKAGQQQLASTKTEQATWKKELEANLQALPSLKESVAGTAKAANALPNDEQLKKSAAELTVKSKEIETRVGELQQLVSQSDQKKVTTEQQLAMLQGELTTAQSAATQSSAEVEQLSKSVGTLNDQLMKQKAALDVATSAIQKADQQVNRWQGEIQFVAELAAVNSELQSAESVVAERAAGVAQAQQELNAFQAKLNAAKQQQADAQAALDEIDQKRKQIRGILPVAGANEGKNEGSQEAPANQPASKPSGPAAGVKTAKSQPADAKQSPNSESPNSAK